MTGDPVVIGFAACTSLAFTAASTLSAMEAGLNNFTATTVLDSFGEAAMGAQVQELDGELPRAARLEIVLRHALADLDNVLPAASADVPALLGMPADLGADERHRLLRVFDGYRVSADGEQGWFPYGRASTFAALRHARALLADGACELLVVVGTDSLCAPATLRRLVQADRVLGPGTEGTIPGEACGCVLLASPSHPVAREAGRFRIEQVALHRSHTPLLNADRVSADALTATFRTLRESGAERVTRVVPAHSGEGYFGRSFAHAYLREVELMPEPLEVKLIADCVGDVGAAAGPIGLAFAAHLMETDGAGRTLVYSESDSGEVGAAIIARHVREGGRA